MSPTSDLLATALAQTGAHPRLSQQRRLYEAAKAAIHQQRLGAGSKLPSSRDLARDLGIARNTVIAAFEQLAAEGYVITSKGSGTYVADLQAHNALMRGVGSAPQARVAQRAALPSVRLSRRGQELTSYAAGPQFEIQPFAPGDPDFSSFPFKLWQRLQNRVWREARNDLLDYGQSGGHQPLRQAITEYLRISRSVKVEVEQVMITAGTQQSLDLCAQLLADAGDTAWVEDPCYWGASRVFQARELKLRPITVDHDGMKLDDKDLATKPRLIYVTPSHQYPTGAVMSLARRRELLDVAVRKDAWILEDDYDSEFRYTGRPLAALQGLDNDDRVLYMGTFSKVLYPGIKVGYLVVPPALIPAFRSALYDLQRPGQLTVQATLTDFITLGHFTTHVRKIRQTYGARRELLRRMLVLRLPAGVTISKEESGLHLVIELPDSVDDVALAQRVAALDISVKALSTYYLKPQVRRGLLVGYAYCTPEQITDYGRQLGAIIAAEVAA
ncbi:aminotransferase class I/II-fold pyridoxal phosphate-dependent enzyme [Duganella sp. FT135W]|uniref:Aminotransferase class I/II-fold pyridoxal phosphate-dependent enzyme n=1 Tax=Duganella flavida TaxID=2692175 RepID=A0A6L8K7W7_9BURK|nr:PLP-dependent aminotransferase family protein [Duganella flavida]MYM23476.1 aminotransferase class I/II-fold pyridoxal phosphate-dependent enzyme [Duganella flavida]